MNYSMWNTKIVKSIPGSIDGILTNFPVAMRIYYNSNINPDFSDLRFSLLDGTNLSYYLVDKVDNDLRRPLLPVGIARLPYCPPAPHMKGVMPYS